jgi:hypothetical protein
VRINDVLGVFQGQAMGFAQLLDGVDGAALGKGR